MRDAHGGHEVRVALHVLAQHRLPLEERALGQSLAVAALGLLTDLLSEFSFTDSIDRSIALDGLLTVLVRGSLMTVPMFLIRAHTPGTGKSYLVDVIAAIATGRLCPVITAAKNEEETAQANRAGRHPRGSSP